MPAISIAEASQALLQILEQQGGASGNGRARELLIEATGRNIGPDYYERIKDHLIAEGLIRRGRGQGGSIALMGDAEIAEPAGPADGKKKVSQRSGKKPLSSEERLASLQGSLEFIPGLLVRRDGRHRRSISLFFGNDADKLFACWDQDKQCYFLAYKVEAGKPDHSDLVAGLFSQIARQPKDVSRDRSGVQLMAGRTVAGINDLCRLLGPLLDDVCLGNAPANLLTSEGQSPQLIGRGSLPLDDRYYEEVATLIQICVERGLKWPMVNWRTALCFDAVDPMIVIGESPTAREKPHREHIVPVSLIRRQAENLVIEGAPTTVVADFIKHHLWIALIHEEEAKLLDAPVERGGVGLKETMPRDWIWGDDPMARLRTVGIRLIMPKPTPVAWTPWRKPIRRRDRVKEFLFGKNSP